MRSPSESVGEPHRAGIAGTLAAASILAAWYTGTRAGLGQYTPAYMWLVGIWIGCQFVVAAAVFVLYRLGAYAWLAALAALAVPLFDPGGYPADTQWLWAGLRWRLAWSAYVLALLFVALLAVGRLARRTDELERHVNREALAIAFATSAALVLAWTLFEDLLPRLRPGYMVVLLVTGWLVGRALVSRRYR